MWWKILLTIAEEMEEPWYETISRIISIYRQDRYVLLENRKNKTRQNIHDYDVGLLIRRLTAGLIDVDKFLEKLVKEMALILINEKGMSMMQALDAIYNSDTYSSLINLKSGLYSQSTAYVYEYLDKELSSGSMS